MNEDDTYSGQAIQWPHLGLDHIWTSDISIPRISISVDECTQLGKVQQILGLKRAVSK